MIHQSFGSYCYLFVFKASPALGDALINAQGFNTVLTSELTKMGVTSTPLPDMEVPTNTANKARRDLLKKIHKGKQVVVN